MLGKNKSNNDKLHNTCFTITGVYSFLFFVFFKIFFNSSLILTVTFLQPVADNKNLSKVCRKLKYKTTTENASVFIYLFLEEVMRCI